PPDTDQKSDDRSRHDTERGHVKRIHQADQKGPAIIRIAAVLNKRLTDIETGAAIEEAESGCDICTLKIGDRVPHDPVDRPDDHPEDDHLIEDAANPRIIQERSS